MYLWICAASAAIQVCPRYSQPDTEPPVVQVEQISDKELSLSYSETVLNADQSSSYWITRDGEMLPVYAVHFDAEKYRAVLSFSETLRDGKYEIGFQNITDDSNEENKLEDNLSFVIDNMPDTEAVTEAPQTEMLTETEFMAETETELQDEGKNTFPMQYLIAGGGGLILLLIVVLLLLSRRSKKKKKETVKITDNVLHLDVRGENEEKRIDTAIDQRIVVGRSSSCDIALLDKLLSRQHFCIEKDNGSFYVVDLGATNGTFVNGVKIGNRCRLKNGDVIQAGTMHITITW